ncbi:hypothetical protein Tco_1088081 [Tanacetum coccineum]
MYTSFDTIADRTYVNNTKLRSDAYETPKKAVNLAGISRPSLFQAADQIMMFNLKALKQLHFVPQFFLLNEKGHVRVAKRPCLIMALLKAKLVISQLNHVDQAVNKEKGVHKYEFHINTSIVMYDSWHNLWNPSLSADIERENVVYCVTGQADPFDSIVAKGISVMLLWGTKARLQP